MRQIEHRLRNIEAKAMASAPQERMKVTVQIVGLHADGYWTVVSEIDEDGNETPVPPERRGRLEGTSNTTAADQFSPERQISAMARGAGRT